MRRLAPLALLALVWVRPAGCVDWNHVNVRWVTFHQTDTRPETINAIYFNEPQEISLPDPITEDPPQATEWEILGAFDVGGNLLAPECQPINITADGQTWSGL